jgi:CubicO group peptidase (beta-lactamase class C family)
VNAGADQSIKLPAGADLQGSATDAEGNALTYAWTASPANGVTFANAAAAATHVTFTTAGTYTLTLTANDGTTSGTDTVVITVAAADGSGNTAPTVNAGADQTITLPTNSADLQGSATDAEGNALTYAWTSSPAEGVTFADPAAAATRVTFTNAGTYTLTLTANDGTTAGTDTVIITVSDGTALAWPGVDPNDPAPDSTHGWIAATPAEVGMDPTIFEPAVNYARQGGGGGMITRHGKLVVQWSDSLDTPDPLDDITIDKKADIKSATKSMGGIALGLALDEGLIQLSDTAVTHLPAIANAPSVTPGEPSLVTIQQLATHTAGFAKPAENPTLEHGPPGTKWFYSDGGLNWLADVLTTKYNRDLSALLTERVWTPLNITTDDLTWRDVPPDANGLKFRNLSSGISANANAMARVGLLFLRKGMWKDQRILSEAFVQTASTPRPETQAAQLIDPAGFPSANLGYGMLWWTNAAGQLANVPTDAYWGWGLGDSLIVVIPSLDIVIARVGRNPDQPGPHWRKEADGTAEWNGDYQVLAPFLVPIVQSVTDPAK